MKNLVFFDVDETLVTKDENGYLIPESPTLIAGDVRQYVRVHEI